MFSYVGVYEYTHPLPPPFLERGIAELVFRRAAYVPLSRIKPSRSSVLCRGRFLFVGCRRVDRLDRDDRGRLSALFQMFRLSCSVGFRLVLSFNVRGVCVGRRC